MNSWSTSTKEADGSPGRLSNIEGKSEKGGLTYLSFAVGGIPVEVYIKGTNGAAKATEGWMTLDEIAQTSGTAAALYSDYLEAKYTEAVWDRTETIDRPIPATDIATAGTAPVTVFNPAPGGGTSGAQTFTVTNPLPTTSALTPTSTPLERASGPR